VSFYLFFSFYSTFSGRTEEDHLNEITALQYIGNFNPNLIGQLDCCEDQDNIYLIMRYCTGGELFTFISVLGPFEEARARGMMRQLINALQHLQQLGVGHR
jgi:serine/threonine protein kinase